MESTESMEPTESASPGTEPRGGILRSIHSSGAAADVGEPASAIADRDLVLRALARLTDRERTVVALRFYLDMPEAQVAAELGLRPGTVKSTTARALTKLRQDADLRADLTSEVL